jgi:hypothetical protein
MNKMHICYCGNTEDPHRFRHSFQETAEVEHTENYDAFVFSGEKFPFRKKETCSFPSCVYPRSFHVLNEKDEKLLKETQQGDPISITHEYTPSIKTYREVRFVLPLCSTCRLCNTTLEDHAEKTDGHIFTTKVILRDKTESDVLIVESCIDEDDKVKNDV